MINNNYRYLIFCFLSVYFWALSAQNIKNESFNQGLTIENRKNETISNCNISNKTGAKGLTISDCENVLIENCKISGVGSEMNSDYLKKTLLPSDSSDFAVHRGNFFAVGLYLSNCKNVIIRNCEITDVFGQGIKVTGDNADKVSGIVIDSCRIAYIYDDGIKVEVKDDQTDFNNVLPMKGIVIRNNLIHDTGLGITQLPYARHGMYVKSRDALIEGNTIYNCFYGEGISLRNAGIVRNNKVWNCYIGCIGFWPQTNTEGSSKTVVIENNICRQDYNMDLKMRHIYFPENDPVLKFNLIQWMYWDPNRDVANITKFIIRNNICIAGPDFKTSQGIMVEFQQLIKNQTLIFEGNQMYDKSGLNSLFVNIPRLKNEAQK